jgi:anthranilate 1,2-dioxygenase ferredoxin subunit
MEATMNQLVNAWHTVGALDDFEEGEPVAVVAGNKPIAVFRLGDDVFALHDLCTHGHARLSEGCVECPLHQGLVDIRTGAPQCAPIVEAVRTYPVRINEGSVEIHVE